MNEDLFKKLITQSEFSESTCSMLGYLICHRILNNDEVQLILDNKQWGVYIRPDDSIELIYFTEDDQLCYPGYAIKKNYPKLWCKKVDDLMDATYETLKKIEDG